MTHLQAATLTAELVSLRHETTALQEQAASLHQQVEAAQAASRSSQSVADESLAKVASSDAAAIASQAAAESQRQQSDILRQQLAEKDGILSSLQNQFDAVMAEIKELRQRLLTEVADAREEQAKRQNQIPDAAAKETIASLKDGRNGRRICNGRGAMQRDACLHIVAGNGPAAGRKNGHGQRQEARIETIQPARSIVQQTKNCATRGVRRQIFHHQTAVISPRPYPPPEDAGQFARPSCVDRR